MPYEDKETSKKIIEKNKILCEKYPYLIPRNVWSRKVIDDYDYSYIEGFGDSPWNKIFMEYVEEIKPWYDSLPEEAKQDFMFTELKEKFGEMRIYTSFTSNEERIANSKAEVKSNWSCYRCGAVPRDSKGNHIIWRSHGWILNYCRDCAIKEIIANNNVSTNEAWKQLESKFSKETRDTKWSFSRNKWDKDTQTWEKLEPVEWEW